MATTTKLRLDHIRDLTAFRRCDADETRVLLELAMKENFLLCGDATAARSVLGHYDKYLWRADQRILASGADSGTRVQALFVFHALIHSLMGRRFGYELRGKRRMCILAEALASSLDLYFTLRVAARVGTKAAFRATALNAYLLASRRLHKSFSKSFDRMAADPFGSYKAHVFFLVDLVERQQAVWAKGPTYSASDIAKVAAFTRKSPFMLYVQHLDVPNFLLYTEARCGSTSSRLDRTQSAECSRQIERSQNLVDLVTWLAGTSASAAS